MIGNSSPRRCWRVIVHSGCWSQMDGEPSPTMASYPRCWPSDDTTLLPLMLMSPACAQAALKEVVLSLGRRARRSRKDGRTVERNATITHASAGPLRQVAVEG